MEAEFGRSSKSKETLIHCNYEYWKHRENANGTIVWRCVKFVKFHCKARLTTRDTRIITAQNPDHTHSGNVSTALARKAVSDMKTRSVELGATPSTSQAAVIENLSNHVQMALPKRTTLNRALNRHRAKVVRESQGGAVHPPLPTDRTFIMPDFCADLVLYDSGPGNDRVMILGCNELLDGLARAEIWIADGTFSVVPSVFFQLYSIHFCFSEGMNPAGVYCLLPNKTADSYVAMLTALHGLIPAAAPVSILVDFERAAMTSFQAAYPQAAVRGCYFHLCQSVLRKVNEIGMKVAYENDDDVRGHVRCLAALAFVPVDDVEEAFDLLAEDMPPHDNMNELLSFFEHTYIRGRRLRGRNAGFGQPLFSPEIWNQRAAAANGIARTTNAVEGWHHGLQSLFQCHHPTMWTFIEGVKKDMCKQRTVLLQGATGVVQPGSKLYRRLRERVALAVEGYSRVEVLTFLRAMSHLSHV